jgi:hypothetical protein
MDELLVVVEKTASDQSSWQMGIEEFDANGCLINGD